MSARDKLRNCFPALPEGASNALIEAAVDEILDDHARELADRLRARMTEMDMYSAAEINQLCRVITGVTTHENVDQMFEHLKRDLP